MESVLAIQYVEWPDGQRALQFSGQKGSGEQRACYSVCPVALVESVLAIKCAEGLW